VTAIIAEDIDGADNGGQFDEERQTIDLEKYESEEVNFEMNLGDQH